MFRYIARSVVVGNCWGGGQVAYKGRRVDGETRDEVLRKTTDMFKDGSLDSGMGFGSLVGAYITIEEIETVTIDAKTFTRSEWTSEIMGEIPEDFDEAIEEFCVDCWH